MMSTPDGGPPKPKAEGFETDKERALREFTETCNDLVERIRVTSVQVERELDLVTRRAVLLTRGMRVLFALALVAALAAAALGAVALFGA